MTKSPHFKPLIFLLVINFAFYTPYLFLFSGFNADDFIIFDLINKNPSRLISFNPQDMFYLFFRPIAYFTFWLDYTLWGDLYLPMKYFTLVLHFLTIIAFYFLLTKLSLVFNFDYSKKLIVLLLIIFSFHGDSLIWVVWIANRTEILFLLFYVISILSMINYFITYKDRYLYFSLLFFVLSVLSKQTGLHLPILFVYLTNISHKQLPDKKMRQKFYFVLGLFFVVLALVLIVNVLYARNPEIVFNNIWKKPFALIGILIHVFIPLYSQTIYNYFLLNKENVMFFLIPASIIVSILWYKRLKFIKLTQLSILLFGLLIISFPRILGAGSGRINSVYLMWGLIVLFYYISKSWNNNKKQVLLLVAIVFIITSGIKAYDSIIWAKREYSQLKSFNILINNANIKNYYVLFSSRSFMFENYYFLNKKFGKDIDASFAPFVLSRELYDRDKIYERNKEIEAKLEGKSIHIVAKNRLILLYYEKDFVNSNYDIILNSSIRSPSGRGFSELVFTIPKNVDLNYYKIIYFDGLNWEIINYK